MLFLLSLLLVVAASYKKKPSKKVPLKKQSSSTKLPKLGNSKADRLERIARSKIARNNDVITLFEMLTDQEFQMLRNFIFTKNKSMDMKYHSLLNAFLRKLNRALWRTQRGFQLTREERMIIAISDKLFINDRGVSTFKMQRPVSSSGSSGGSSSSKPSGSGTNRIDYPTINVNSSWILTARYTASTGMLRLTMIRSGKIYKFPKVPRLAYLALISQTAHAGTFWWRNWYWKYSTNPRWAKLRRK